MHQSVTRLHSVLCAVFQLEPEQLQIIVRDIGGGFGTKVAVHPEDILVVYAAKKLKATCKMDGNTYGGISSFCTWT
jgi:Aerobic-type carbon monoxide dehydrogenase, large subunit CoxL/CutL homologs